MQHKTSIRVGFILAGLINVFGILLFSKGFSNSFLTALQPQLLSPFGYCMIALWGLAYLAVAKQYERNRLLIAIFAIEKLCYVVAWCLWMSQHADELLAVYDKDLLSGIFMSIYGLNDLLFMLFFAWVFVGLVRKPST